MNSPQAPSARRKIARAVVISALAFLVADQVVLRTLLEGGEFRGRRIAPFDPPLFTPEQRARVEAYDAFAASGEDSRAGSNFESELGWCPRPSTEEGEARFDTRGARIGAAPVPIERTPGVRRVVALGCSFTYGAKVTGKEAWFARVDDARADLEIVNYAFGAFGLDQALLRWRRDGVRERPDEVWLGILPSAALRNVTMYMPAMRHWTGVVGIKPRFELGPGGELELVPSPARTLADLVRLVRSQREFCAALGGHDHWMRGHPAAYAPIGSSWMHHFATTRVLLTLAEREGREAKPYLADPGSEVHRLESELVRELRREVETSGARFRALVLPDRADLVDRAEKGRGYWQGLVDEFERDGIEVIDTSAALATAGAADDASAWVPDGHYSAEGNRIVADEIARRIATR